MTLSAIALGLAVSSMHYTAMSASIFVASAQTHAISFLVDGVYLLLPIVSFLSILTVLTVFIAPFRHRLLNAQILAAYFEKSSDGIVVADHNGTILEFNPAACQLFGYSADEIIGKNVAILVPDEDRTSHEQHVSSFVPQGDSDVLGMKRELVAQRKDGSRFAVKIFLSSASAGGAITLIATIHDVSKEKQLRDAQDRANSALQEALEHQTEQTEKQKRFVSMVSHEFRTPLAIIDGNARRIQKKVGAMSEDQVVERTAKIQAAVARMTGLMESNLMRGRNESAAMGLDLVWLDPAELVSDACIEQAELCADHEIVFDPGTLPHKALVDLSGIRQVLNNLLSNAAKYSPGCGTIHVSGHSDSGQLFIDVKDYGVGIPQAELPLLFGEYFRASTASGIAGTGLGLALSREIARAHDGDITVDCKSGESTTFTLSLPIEGPAASSSECRDGTDWGS